MVDDVVLPGSGAARRQALGELFPGNLVDAVDSVGSEQLTVLPLTARGRCFGVLVLGRAPGYGFTGSQSFLEDLAARVAVGLDTSLVVAESRYIATVLRDSLAPPTIPDLPGLGVATVYRVAHESEDVGGDFLDIHGTPEDLTLVCGDVAGKGVEAAVHAKDIRNSVRTAALVERTPAWILGLINRVVVAEADEFSEGLATAVCARLRRHEGVLRVDLANAGHPPALLLRSDGTVVEVDAGGVALGLLAESDYAETVVDLQPLDTLVLYTDGVTDARGLDGMYGDLRLQALLRGLGGLSASAVVQLIAVAIGSTSATASTTTSRSWQCSSARTRREPGRHRPRAGDVLDCRAGLRRARGPGGGNRGPGPRSPHATVLQDLVVATQLRIGEHWASNTCTVAREHAATAVSESVVRRLAERVPEPTGTGVLLVGCAEREWHALPALVVAESLRSWGLPTVYLGPSTSRDQLVSRILDVGPRAVLLSASLTSSFPRVRRQIEAARGTGTAVLVGGAAFDRRAYGHSGSARPGSRRPRRTRSPCSARSPGMSRVLRP